MCPECPIPGVVRQGGQPPAVGGISTTRSAGLRLGCDTRRLRRGPFGERHPRCLYGDTVPADDSRGARRRAVLGLAAGLVGFGAFGVASGSSRRAGCHPQRPPRPTGRHCGPRCRPGWCCPANPAMTSRAEASPPLRRPDARRRRPLHRPGRRAGLPRDRPRRRAVDRRPQRRPSHPGYSTPATAPRRRAGRRPAAPRRRARRPRGSASIGPGTHLAEVYGHWPPRAVACRPGRARRRGRRARPRRRHRRAVARVRPDLRRARVRAGRDARRDAAHGVGRVGSRPVLGLRGGGAATSPSSPRSRSRPCRRRRWRCSPPRTRPDRRPPCSAAGSRPCPAPPTSSGPPAR